jgi:glucose/arabinose dehydrogenase
VLWVTHNAYSFSDAPDWTGSLSRMSGTDLATVQHVLVHLPRSWRDHLTNQPHFGPDGALYFPQGRNTSYGAPDDEWGQRVQHLLCATILRLDVSKLDALERPLDVKTPDGGGSYDPAAPGAPLTIYASGVRNAYSLLWHSNGKLYAPVNGSQPGGNTPAGPGVPALQKIAASENDWLFKITAPGRYFGHPNEVQKHFVLNGGNPTARRDPFEIPEYPVGTRPDPAWTPPVFDFGAHISPNGVIEYTSDAFGGKLKHRLMVCRYNIGADIIVLALDENGDVRSSQIGIAGLGNLDNPLDLAEDPRNGNLYVSE